MSIYDWIEPAKAQLTGDSKRVGTHIFMYSLFQDKLKEATSGRDYAAEVGEAWFEMLFQHFRLQRLLFWETDYDKALEEAVAATVRMRDETFRDFPQRICLHEDLISAYLGIDPVGYAGLIEQALNYMEQEMQPDVSCRFCLLAHRFELQLACGQKQQARDVAETYLVQSENQNDHHWSDACLKLCQISFQQQDWESLHRWSRVGEDVARRNKKTEDVMEHLAWQAVAQAELGNSAEATRLFNASLATESNRMPETTYDAHVGYHEAMGQLADAAAVRTRQIEAMRNSGQMHFLALAHIDHCRLLAKSGQPIDEAQAAAEAAINHQKEPALYQRWLADALGHQ